MSRASGGPDTPQKNRNDISDLLRAMPVKASVKDGKRLERFGEVWIVDETDEWP